MKVSVVMSVYNGAKYLRESVESILSQEGVDFEFIIVNDGSTDDSGIILAEYAIRDDRIRIIEQDNTGLTKALIRGCNEAQGKYIARQDSGDMSNPDRLKKQVEYLEFNPDVALVSCWVRFVGPEDEELYCIKRQDTHTQATRNLRSLNHKKVRGISHHGSAMFRMDDYMRVGGYSQAFYFAQDLDLWLRLTDIGHVAFVQEILYQARLEPSCISMHHYNEQAELLRIAVELVRVRQIGGDDTILLHKAANIKPSGEKRNSSNNANGLYFIGKCLIDRGDRRGINYVKRAVRSNPFMFKYWLAFFNGIYRFI